jgi:SecD/SecF fusion protein
VKQRSRAALVLLTVIGLVAASLVVVALKPTVLGLDLQGGVQVVLQGEPTAQSQVTPEAIDKSVQIIRNRVDALGTKEPEIQTEGTNRISVSLPGVSNPDQVVEDLIRPAQLAFYDYQKNLVGAPSADLYALTQRAATTTPMKVLPHQTPTYYLFTKNGHRFVSQATALSAFRNDPTVAARCGTPATQRCVVVKVPAGLVIVRDQSGPVTNGQPTPNNWDLLQDQPALTGKDISSARAQLDQRPLAGSQPIVAMNFTGSGKTAFAQITKDLAERGALRQTPQTFAIVLDGVIISNPQVDYRQYPSGIDPRNGAQIEGNFSMGDARKLADQLNSGAIPINLKILQKSQVSATLGKQSLHQGLVAGIVGLVLVMLFLIGYYRLLGLVADMALLIYGVLFYAVVKLIPITMTLPGIAGMILTIGVAADANVVIFERVREEARAGRTARTAVLNGYRKGISAIIDANVVTLGTAAILFLFTTASVKGFALTLFIGVILSLFTAVLATRAVFGLLADTKVFQNERLMGLHQREPRWKLDFVGKWKLWMAISFVPLAIGTIWIGVHGLNLGLDFKSGTRMAFTVPHGVTAPSENGVRGVLQGLGYGDAKIQNTTQTLNGQQVHGFQLQTKTLQQAQETQVTNALEQRFQGLQKQETVTVGPAFGRDIIRNAIYAIVISFLIIALYLTIRFEYKLALPALLSVVHDVWLTLCIYSIVGREVTSATVAAVLTILGYSLYDVVIVFDRIRENAPLMRGSRYRNVVNRSVHETLNRSMITSFLTLLPVVILLIFGGDTLKDFAFALLIGLLSGGLSSIAIAAPIAALWKEREPAARRVEARERRRAARAAPTDSDIVDVAALARAEAALEAADRRGDDYAPLIDGEAEEMEPTALPAVADTADVGDLDAARGDDIGGDGMGDGEADGLADVGAGGHGDNGEAPERAAPRQAPAPRSGDGTPAPPQRVRRHRQVQRKRRR